MLLRDFIYPVILCLAFGIGRYKFLGLGAILLLALWLMFIGILTLHWFAKNLNWLYADVNTPIHNDLDVLIRIPRFWQEAFEAAYEDLTSDVLGVREAAISEIAKLYVRSINLAVQSTLVDFWIKASGGSIQVSTVEKI
ncbi:hypothetical protein UlMin_019180 [Ulmus minor]